LFRVDLDEAEVEGDGACAICRGLACPDDERGDADDGARGGGYGEGEDRVNEEEEREEEGASAVNEVASGLEIGEVR